MKNLKLKALSWSLFVVFAACWLVMALISGKKVIDLWSATVIGYQSVPIVVTIATIFALYGWRWRFFILGWCLFQTLMARGNDPYRRPGNIQKPAKLRVLFQLS
jgi:hypothetical protein